MAAGIMDFEIEIGARWWIFVSLQDEAGQPYTGLAGCDAHMQLRDLGGDLIADLSTSNGRLSIDPATGDLEIDLGATVTATIEASKGEYDLLAIPANPDHAWKVLRGRLTFVQGVTRDH